SPQKGKPCGYDVFEAIGVASMVRPRDTPRVKHDEHDAAATIVTARALVSDELAAEFHDDLFSPPRVTKGRVLIVEASPSSLVRVLESADYEVKSVDDGVEASQWLASSEFDVVITETSPKGCSGIELLRFVQEHHRGLPVLLTTGEPDFDV